MDKPKLTLFTSLYPNPWKPTQATFNFQQYEKLSEDYDLLVLVPVPWLLWFKNLRMILFRESYQKAIYFPFFYFPKFLTRYNSIFLLISIFISIIPLVKIARSKKVVASFALPDGVACAFLTKIFSFKLYIQCLGSDVNFHSQDKFKRKLLGWSFSKATATITVSKALEEKVLTITPNAIVKTIYNGVNFDKFKIKAVTTEKSNNIIFIGNIIKTKGIVELVDAAKTLLDNNKNLSFHIVGEGIEKLKLEQSIATLGLSSSIKFYGAINHDQISNLLHDADLLVLPSYREGVPNVIMEALACGLPVVATKVGGIPEVVNSSNGILLDSYRVEDIVSGIEQCLDRIWKPDQIRESISSYTWENNTKQLANIIG